MTDESLTNRPAAPETLSPDGVSGEAVLEASGLTKQYESGDRLLTVLEDVSLALDRGETCTVVGPSGSGKTTLLALCAGLEAPSSGSVRLLGRRLETMDEDERADLRRSGVGFVFQTFQLIPTLTALENVLVPLELGDWTERSDVPPRRRARTLLDEVGLGERLDHYPAQLSGGEQQRVSLARAFANRPEILFADEPTGNLDTETGRHIEDLLFDLNEQARTTLVLVTHDLDLAERTQRTLHLRGGRLEPSPPEPSSRP